VSLTLVGALALAGADACTVAADQHSSQEGTREPEKTMKLRMALEHTSITVTIVDSATSRDFVAMLPLTLTLVDYAETEKISELPKRMSTQSAPTSVTPAAGDVTYYAPWGNLAIFHKSFRYSEGLIKLGTIDSGLEALRQPGPLRVTIERIVD
jgi:hypothetical protein